MLFWRIVLDQQRCSSPNQSNSLNDLNDLSKKRKGITRDFFMSSSSSASASSSLSSSSSSSSLSASSYQTLFANDFELNNDPHCGCTLKSAAIRCDNNEDGRRNQSSLFLCRQIHQDNPNHSTDDEYMSQILTAVFLNQSSNPNGTSILLAPPLSNFHQASKIPLTNSARKTPVTLLVINWKDLPDNAKSKIDLWVDHYPHVSHGNIKLNQSLTTKAEKKLFLAQLVKNSRLHRFQFICKTCVNQLSSPSVPLESSP